MANLSIAFIILCLILNVNCLSKAKDQPKFARWSVGNYISGVNATINFQLEFTTPIKPGPYQVIFFLTGFDGLAPTFVYSDFIGKLAVETNSIVVAFDKFSTIKKPDIEENLFEITLNWTIANLQTFFNSSKTPSIVRNKVVPDVNSTSGFTMLSHSSAAHPVVLYLNKTCGSMKKLVLMNPVDGYDPFGFVKIFVTNPPKQLPFTTPTLVIANGLDPVPVINNFVSCAPTNISDMRFYNSLPGPTWYLNYTDYGHADILDGWVRNIGSRFVCSICGSKDKNVKCDFDLYAQNIAKAINYFIKGVNTKSAYYLNALNNPQASGLFDSKIQIDSNLKSNGYDVLSSGPFCNHL